MAKSDAKFSNKLKNCIHNLNLNTMELLKSLKSRARKAIGEIKKLVTDYRKASVKKTNKGYKNMSKLFQERIPFKPFEYPIYYNEGWLKQAQAFGFTPRYPCKWMSRIGMKP